ncbi:hypothetical protein RvVAT039_pl08920 (plasmid) [Agrobacterium vitis]|nr:hypothetical protein BBL07_19660 [Agrobacterium vitis]BCH68059.1 hypothetical protein RvVAT039_pl08920 [Agrobacterium vitis]
MRVDLSCFLLVVQAALSDGVSFDLFAFEQYGLAAPGVDVGWGKIVEAFVIAPMVVVLDKSRDLSFEVLLEELGPDSVNALEDAAHQIPEEIVTVVGAEGRGGAGLIAVRALNPKFARSRPSPVAEPVTKGFRAGKAPPTLGIVDSYLSHNIVAARATMAR